jgi:hypothetical protein
VFELRGIQVPLAGVLRAWRKLQRASLTVGTVLLRDCIRQKWLRMRLIVEVRANAPELPA